MAIPMDYNLEVKKKLKQLKKKKKKRKVDLKKQIFSILK